MNVPPEAIKEFQDRPDVVHCETYKATMSARTCLSRQAIKDNMSPCSSCRQGKKIKKQFDKQYHVIVRNIHVPCPQDRRVVVEEQPQIQKAKNEFKLTAEQRKKQRERSVAAQKIAWQLYKDFKKGGIAALEHLFAEHPDLYNQIDDAADENLRSMQKEIIFRLKESFK